MRETLHHDNNDGKIRGKMIKVLLINILNKVTRTNDHRIGYGWQQIIIHDCTRKSLGNQFQGGLSMSVQDKSNEMPNQGAKKDRLLPPQGTLMRCLRNDRSQRANEKIALNSQHMYPSLIRLQTSRTRHPVTLKHLKIIRSKPPQQNVIIEI